MAPSTHPRPQFWKIPWRPSEDWPCCLCQATLLPITTFPFSAWLFPAHCLRPSLAQLRPLGPAPFPQPRLVIPRARGNPPCANCHVAKPFPVLHPASIRLCPTVASVRKGREGRSLLDDSKRKAFEGIWFNLGDPYKFPFSGVKCPKPSPCPQ